MSILYEAWDDPQGAVPCARRGCHTPADRARRYCAECRDELWHLGGGALLMAILMAAAVFCP
jgi:hypothetical protein